MSCRSEHPTFRLLDGFVGWDAGPGEEFYKNLTGLDDPGGVRLKQQDGAAVDPAQVLAYIPPRRLAHGCGPCDWYLVTATPPAPRLLRMGLSLHRSRFASEDCSIEESLCQSPCVRQWVPVWDSSCAPNFLVNVVSVAAWRQRIAVADQGAGMVWIWAQSGARLSAAIKINKPGPIAFTPSGQLLVVDEDSLAVLRFGPTGDALGKLKAKIPDEIAQGDADRIAVSNDQSVWLVTRAQDGSLQLWRAAQGAQQFEQASVEQLPKVFRPTGITAASDLGFCLQERGTDGMPVTCCFSWYGRCVDQSRIVNPKPPARYQRGQLLTAAIDSGVPRCQWHRVQVDADMPPGTTISLAVSTSEDARARGAIVSVDLNARTVTIATRPNNPALILSTDENTVITRSGHPAGLSDLQEGDRVSAAFDSSLLLAAEIEAREAEPVETAGTNDEQSAGTSDAEWTDFPTGAPHPTDWQIAPDGSLDFLINQPTGRYLYVRMRLVGDSAATPVVRRVRLDFPRVTSAEFLPALYRENPVAEDFTERFLSLFDAAITDIDRAIERFPALLDANSVPDEVLPWLGSFLDLTFDHTWEPQKRRKILHALPELYRLRGTVAGLKKAISLVFDVDSPVIQELASERNWGAVGRDTLLGGMRLFSKSRARFRLGGSPLSEAPIRLYGNPDEDPLNSHAYRFRVLLPPSMSGSEIERERLERLVASQKPAHTVASVRIGGKGLVLGYWSSVGVDTAFAALPPPVLGKEGNVRLRRMTVLWHGRKGSTGGVVLGQTAVVGLGTVME
ncbi:MAG TPA: phage tail protein [Blastocatellia bacterium]|nr:phage tail protein [Blastocatellia bacterium]